MKRVLIALLGLAYLLGIAGCVPPPHHHDGPPPRHHDGPPPNHHGGPHGGPHHHN